MVIELAVAVIAGALSSVVISSLGAWLSKRKREAKINVSGSTVDIDLSSPESLAKTISLIGGTPQVFLASSREDSEIARKIVTDLRRQNIRVWSDLEQVKPGDIIKNKIREGLISSGYVLAILSRHSLNSEWTRKEVDMALKREEQGKWPRVIPVLVDNVDIPVSLRDKHYIDLRQDYLSELNKLIDSIQPNKDLPAHLAATTGIVEPVPFEDIGPKVESEKQRD